MSCKKNDAWKMKLSLLGTNISPKNGILKMIFLFPRWDMLIPWRVPFSNMLPFPRGKKIVDLSGLFGSPGSAWRCSSALLRANGDGSWRSRVQVEEIGFWWTSGSDIGESIFKSPWKQTWLAGKFPFSFWNRRYTDKSWWIDIFTS